MIALAGGLLAVLGLDLAGRRGSSSPGIIETGELKSLRARPAPDFSLTLFDSTPFKLSEQRGKVLLINFWASWCPPCRAEAPALEATWKAFRDRGFVLLGLNAWDKEADARAFLKEFGITYPNGPEGQQSIAVEYGVRGLPESFFVDRKGILVRQWIGPLTAKQLAGLLEPLLTQPPSP